MIESARVFETSEHERLPGVPEKSGVLENTGTIDIFERRTKLLFKLLKVYYYVSSKRKVKHTWTKENDRHAES
jgi:hypothetical protein